MKNVRYLVSFFLLVAVCVGLTGCGEKYVDLPENICREWVLAQDIQKSMEIEFFDSLLGDHVEYYGGYDKIDEVSIAIMPGASTYNVKEVGNVNGVTNSITVKYTGEEIVFFRNKDEIGRCKYELYDDVELLLLTFTKDGAEQSVGLMDASAY